ncbi:MAG: transporter permease [Solirubrobacterales bacterium]|jgi:ABC-type polysaccharide/polyol phosphate export permease|nr:transporter permease [Solirubrobacterales bacterium]
MSTETVHKAPPPQEDPAALADGWADAYTPEHHVYEPHKVGLPPLGPYLSELWRRREFAVELARTKLQAQHFGTVFGMTWLVLNPLLLAGVYFILIDILRSGDRPPGAFAHLLGSIFAYYLVSDAIRMSSRSVTGGGKLILNTAFPRMLLPLSSVLVSIIRFLPTIAILAIVHIATGRPNGLNMLWAFPVALEMIAFATGASVLVAAAQVYFRDLNNFLPYMLRVWLYVSPVLWQASEVPHGYKWLLYVNPLGPMLTAWNEALNQAIRPGGTWLLLGAGYAIVALVIGGLFFISREREFAVRV